MQFAAITRLRERIAIVVCAGAAGLSLLAGLAQPAVAQGYGVMVVRADRGGLLGQRSAEIRQLQASGQRVELRGTCYSACTMYLGLPNVCIDPAADFGFHGPSAHGAPLPPAQFEHWSQVMAAGYRGGLRDWYMQTARYTISGFFRLSGAELIRMGYPRC